MRNPWRILGIRPTRDEKAIARARRRLVQKYHPDKATTPERKRRHATRFSEALAAYESAMVKAQEIPEEAIEKKAVPAGRRWLSAEGSVQWEWIGAIIILLLTSAVALLLPDVGTTIVHLGGDPAVRTLVAVASGMVIGSMLGLFLLLHLIAFWKPVAVLLQKLGYGRYSDKAGWGCSVILWLAVWLVIGMPEPGVAGLSWWVCVFVAFGFGPVYALGVWCSEYWKYRKLQGGHAGGVNNSVP